MLQLPKNETSYWHDSLKPTNYPQLTQDLTVDVVIVGGGVCGLNCAYLLKQAGLSVAVIEKDTIGSGTTGHTTGKVTSQHNLMYADLEKHLGRKIAQIYAQANQKALERVKEIINNEKIDCGWQDDDNYVYTTKSDQIGHFKKEAEAAAKLGLPASFETNSPLPFEIQAAVKFTGQGKMNAQKYVAGLAATVNGQGSYVFEDSRVIDFNDGKPAKVRTTKATVNAKDIIVATNVPTFPLLARGTYCALEYPHTSYIVAGCRQEEMRGMYISPDSGHYSILPVDNGQEQLLLIGGENHIPGTRRGDPRYQKLADYAEHYFGIKEVAYCWKARDYIPYDGVPLVGKVYPWSRHLYTATAFKKWGLTNTMVAAMILHDLILGQPNDWAEIYTPHRLLPILSIPRVIAKSLN